MAPAPKRSAGPAGPAEPAALAGRRRGAGAAMGLGLCYVAALVVTSLIRPPAMLHAIGSPLAHAGGYALAVLILFPLLSRARERLVVLAALWLLGAALEAAQAMVSWRSGKLLDIGYNTLGLACGAAVVLAAEGLWRLFRAR